MVFDPSWGPGQPNPNVIAAGGGYTQVGARDVYSPEAPIYSDPARAYRSTKPDQIAQGGITLPEDIEGKMATGLAAPLVAGAAAGIAGAVARNYLKKAAVQKVSGGGGVPIDQSFDLFGYQINPFDILPGGDPFVTPGLAGGDMVNTWSRSSTRTYGVDSQGRKYYLTSRGVWKRIYSKKGNYIGTTINAKNIGRLKRKYKQYSKAVSKLSFIKPKKCSCAKKKKVC